MTGLETDRESHPGAIVEQLASSQSAPICRTAVEPSVELGPLVKATRDGHSALLRGERPQAAGNSASRAERYGALSRRLRAAFCSDPSPAAGTALGPA